MLESFVLDYLLVSRSILEWHFFISIYHNSNLVVSQTPKPSSLKTKVSSQCLFPSL
ncbi:hypothetical protein HanPSC8_Chr13g0566751 [Helianthus annuus]|nr:hypothetical protein HanPSC8_Chr13g0566751 [Helianthus annuus]